MAQFDVYRNSDAQTKDRVPYLLDIQNDLFDELDTRLVVPLVANSRILQGLNFEIMIRNQSYVISTQELRAIPLSKLQEKVFSLEDKSKDILAGIQFLLMGFEVK